MFCVLTKSTCQSTTVSIRILTKPYVGQSHTECIVSRKQRSILEGMVSKNKLSQLLKRDTFLMQLIPALIVFLALLAFAIGSWQNAVLSRGALYEKAVERRITTAQDRLDERMKTSGSLLRAGGGLLYGSESVTLDEWQQFYGQLIEDESYIGACTVGYAPIVDVAERMDFEAQLVSLGVATGISTDDTTATTVPILHGKLIDQDAEIAYGQDLYTDTEYRKAMEKARDSGRVTMTGITHTPENTNEHTATLFLPIYTKSMPSNTIAEKRAALTGYVFETLHVDEIYSSLTKETEEAFGFVVYERTSDGQKNEVFRSASMQVLKNQPLPTREVANRAFDKTWIVDYYASDNILATSERQRPTQSLLIWLGIAFVSGGLAYVLLKYRTRLFALAEEQKLQQAKDELLSLASHQLRTPATGVKQYVGMVLDGFGGPVPKDQVKLLEQAYKSNERQLQIINEFLYVAKLGSGSLITSKHKFDLAPLVRDVVEEMSIESKERHHKVQIKAPKSVPIKADEHSIRMIIENILSNAIKYTQPGGKIEVKLQQVNREATICIKDNGVGISKKDQKQLFKQFSRIPNELTNDVSGSGIGLYLAQQLAVRNGGKITVESDTARGSTFTLTLPNWRVKKITIPKRSA